MKEKIMMLSLEGYCCSQIIFILALEHLGKDNPDLIKAMRGLCGGMGLSEKCGALSAGFCLLSLIDNEKAKEYRISQLNDWFTETFGTTSCYMLVGDDDSRKETLCPTLIQATYEKLTDLLEW
ncbi:MAG: DVU_1555 family C-GCAxxG-C-C protein [Anaerovoracaceae bacterium]